MWFNDRIREQLFNLGWQEYGDSSFERIYARFSKSNDGSGDRVIVAIHRHSDRNYRIVFNWDLLKKNDKGTWELDGDRYYHEKYYCNSGFCKTMPEAIEQLFNCYKPDEGNYVDAWGFRMANKALDELAALDWSVEEK